MELTLLRTYYPEGTNGQLMENEKPVSYTIELPWKNNEKRKSCIPEGRYLLKEFHSKKHGFVLEVCDVPNRSAILIHKANDAKKQLLGCIGPVTTLDKKRMGVGWNSGKALAAILSIAIPAIEKGEEVVLTIKKA